MNENRALTLITLIWTFLAALMIWALPPDLSQIQKNIIIFNAVILGIIISLWILFSLDIRQKAEKKRKARLRMIRCFTVAVLIICIVVTTFCWSLTPEPAPTPTSSPTPTPTPTLTPAANNLTFPGTAWTPSDPSAKPSKTDIDSVKKNPSYPNDITYPKTSSYLDRYKVMYVQSGKGDSIYLFWSPKCTTDTKRNHYVYEGNAVTVIAQEKNASCIIYMNDDGYPIAGWVASEYLVSK